MDDDYYSYGGTPRGGGGATQEEGEDVALSHGRPVVSAVLLHTELR
jgi:hypothetical protein